MTLDEKLDFFYKSAIDDATNQSISIIAEYKESLNKELEESKNNLIRKSEINFENESKKLIREKNKILSNELIELKRIISDRTKELTDNLFTDVENKLNEFRTTEDYMNLLVKQINEAKAFAKTDDLIIYIDPKDESMKLELEQQTLSTIQISSFDFFGGTRVVIPSRNILIDNSFVTKITEQKETFTI